MRGYRMRFMAFLLGLLLLTADILPLLAADRNASESISVNESISLNESISSNGDVSGNEILVSDGTSSENSTVPEEEAAVVPTPVPVAGDSFFAAQTDLSSLLIHKGAYPEAQDKNSMELLRSSDQEALRECILEGLQKREAKINIISYNIHKDEIGAIYTSLVNSHPELFYVSGATCIYFNYLDQVEYIEPGYDAEYTEEDVAVFETKLQEILSSVDPCASDTEKILYIHEYLVTHCEYDSSMSASGIYNAYGALVNGLAVCHGYSEAFLCLMDRLGIEGQVVSSRKLDHTWNVLKLGQEWYYVDVTWDDPLGVDEFYCRHINLLRNRNGMIETGHDSEDWVGAEDFCNVYEDLACGCAYEDFFWEDIFYPLPVAENATLVLDGKNLHFYDLASGQSNTVSMEEQNTAITAVAGQFYVANTSQIIAVSKSGEAEKVYILNVAEASRGGIYDMQPLSYGIKYYLRSSAGKKIVSEGIFIIEGLPLPEGVKLPEQEDPSASTPTEIPVAKDDSLYMELADGKEYVYSGKKICPVVNVFYRGKLLEEGRDYTVKYSNNLNVGSEAQVKVIGKTFFLSGSCFFTILPKNIADADVSAPPLTIQKGNKAVPALYFGNSKLKAKDYTYDKTAVYEENASVLVSGCGNYCGEREVEINVLDGKPQKLKVSFKPIPRVYNGLKQKLMYGELVVYDAKSSEILMEGVDYTVIYPLDTVNVGKVKLFVVGIGAYAGTVTKSYRISALKTDEMSVNVQSSCDYDPLGAYPGVSVYYQNRLLERGRDYKLSCSANKKAGTGRYSISFLGNYKGSKKCSGTYEICAKDLQEAQICVADRVYHKPGQYKSQLFASVDGYALKTSDYSVSYFVGDEEISGRRKITEADFTEDSLTVSWRISGKGNYKGTCEGTYSILKKDEVQDLSDAKLLIRNRESLKKMDSLPYTGEPVAIGDENELYVTMPGTGAVLEEGKDFELQYFNNVNTGKALILLQGIGDYAGGKSGSFRIVKGTYEWQED